MTDSEELRPDHFEDIVSAALKVDPAGLSGKHRREERKLYTARGQKTEDGWLVTVAGVSAFRLVHPKPTVEMVRQELAATLQAPPDSFDVRLDLDYVGFAP